ncbi:glycoside hydrolase family 55 protein [Dothidotthia symphoricarpi CBS 119687]|uniref:Glycoside hydrolase family 55 protein n=1 Tax=Dothidotthia symphoricarpi CBS 119687 TaxID=1392245 RepID=A0A6A5ZYJ0_9PLEO|nr:glycoside hydrolase family 55 protein [Dothidotthia symphoricarpi CBS 119687]KAF2124812.1 glycoside hydrolase family 55 protein [Dothidotthia symphoricarpi CBS 119687]
MVAFSASAFLLTLRVLLSATPSAAVPIAQANTVTAQANASASSYWFSSIKRQGQAPFNANKASYTVFRNVKELGAAGDGVTDDTDVINKIIADGDRCGEGCDSTTTTPAIIYFPAGTYMISKPIIQYYYTQFVGDALNLPVLKATADFEGMGVIDADPYIPGGNGANWYTNQNNFYRQIRNFVIDITGVKAAAGIHWQVSQATSLQNIRFEMDKGDAGAEQKGIFQDNGSGGFMSDLIFNGGAIGAFLGSQQFTTRNMTFNDCGTAIYMNWNWLWTLKSIFINNCKVGLDMANSPSNQTVGSVLLLDSKFVNTPVGVNSSFTSNSVPETGGSLVLDNVDFTGSTTAVEGSGGNVILAGGSKVATWAQGNAMASGSEQSRIQGNVNDAPTKPESLLGDNGWFERSKPQYENIDVSKFVSLKSKGAVGDGATDDTAAIQAAIDGLQDGEILHADHGAYLITKTIVIPAEKNIKIVGEIYTMFFITGEFFSNMDDPKPGFQVGKASGDKGSFEMSDAIISTQGPAPGGILMEWNINAEAGQAGLWDVHFRVGGFEGTKLQYSNCAKNPNATHDANPDCIGSFMQLHITKESNGYFENVWLWTADHELDQQNGTAGQIDIYNGRGMLVESQGPVWLVGTASEHSQMSQYHFQGAKDIWYGAIQTETPYYQPNPAATVPFTVNEKYFDPDFSQSESKSAWAVRIIDSTSLWNYGAGTYSFFSNYAQECLDGENCQTDINQVDNSTNVNWFGLSTKASVNMITSGGKGLLKDADNRSNFCATVAIFAVGA